MFTQKTFENLLKPTSKHVISIYMPTHQHSPKDRNQDKTRLRNLIDQAEQDLIALGGKQREVTSRLRPARELLTDEPFWQNQRQGLAVFISPKTMRVYHLPIKTPELIVTAKRYHIKPLLPLLDFNRQFYVLCVSPNKVKLFKADLESISLMESKGLPENINEALGQDDNERSLQHFVASTNGSTSWAVFHGRGGAKDLNDIDPPRFIRAVADAVGNELQGVEAGLLFAGDDKLFSLYQEHQSNVRLFERHLSGNHDDIKPDELHRKVLEIVKPYFQANIDQAVDTYSRVRAKTPKLAAEEPARIAEAALEGKVGELLMSNDRQKWGRLGDDMLVTASLGEREPGAVDLFDVAAAAALEHGGQVYTAGRDAVPGVSGMAAVLRY